MTGTRAFVTALARFLLSDCSIGESMNFLFGLRSLRPYFVFLCSGGDILGVSIDSEHVR